MDASSGKGAFFGLHHGLRRVSERYGCLGGAFASARYGCLDGGAHRFGTMEAPQRRPLVDDWHGGDSTDVLDAEDEAAYIAGTRTRLEGVPRRPDSPSSLDAIAEAEEPPAAAAREGRRKNTPVAYRPPPRATRPRPRARPPPPSAYEAGLSAPPLEVGGAAPRGPAALAELVALEHVGGGGAYGAEPTATATCPGTRRSRAARAARATTSGAAGASRGISMVPRNTSLGYI